MGNTRLYNYNFLKIAFLNNSSGVESFKTDDNKVVCGPGLWEASLLNINRFTIDVLSFRTMLHKQMCVAVVVVELWWLKSLCHACCEVRATSVFSASWMVFAGERASSTISLSADPNNDCLTAAVCEHFVNQCSVSSDSPDAHRLHAAGLVGSMKFS